MPNLIYPYLIGMVSTVIIPLVAIIAYVTAHMRGAELERLRRRLPLATRFEDLQMRVADLEKQRDELSEELAQSHQIIDQADRERQWLEQHREEIEQMRVEKEQLERHRQEYDRVTRELAEQNEKLEAATKSLKMTVFEHEKRQEHIKEAQAHLSRLAEQVKTNEQELSRVRGEVSKAEAALKKAQEREQETSRKVAELQAKEASLQPKVQELTREHRDLARKVDDLERQANEAKSQQRSSEARLAGLKTSIEEATGHLDKLRAESRKRDRALATAGEALAELWQPAIKSDEFPEKPAEGIDEMESLANTEQYLKELGLVFPSRTVKAFHTALKTADQTPLLVLAGISGTGKSLLPRRYAEGMGIHFLSVPVQPRWDGPQDLLGFFNYLENRYKATELVRALIQFDEYCADWVPEQFCEHFLDDRMLVVLLDEMNLARVEYYFSEFLSRLETRRDIDVANNSDRRKASLLLDVGETGNEPPRVFVDRNVMFVGTMNEDESTMSLSDKVIDRAAVMRFGRPRSLESSRWNPEAPRARAHLPKATWMDWIEAGNNRAVRDHARSVVERLNEALSHVGRPFGYRTRDAILAYVRQYPDQDDHGQQHALADQIEQRVMPRLRGLDTADDVTTRAVQDVLDVVQELEDDELRDAIEKARSPQTGHLFQWGGVARKVEE